MSQMAQRRPSPLEAAARCLFIDGVTAGVVTAWRDRGIESILIKGPTVASWLYGDDLVRSYGDSDLFVRPGDNAGAHTVLQELGFTQYEAPNDPGKHTTNWRRDDGAQVDLHHALFGSWVPAERQWQLLRDGYTETMRVGNADVDVPTIPARALLVAIHAAQHRDHAHEKPLEDLRRAVATADHDTWVRAASLADDLDAIREMADGLALDAAGVEVALSLQGPGAYLRAPSFARSGVVWVERIAAAPSGRARLRVFADAVFPEPATMRRWSPVARRGRGGLVAAYVGRVAWMLANAVPVTISWLRARRDARQT
jgi:hypothetical protein